MINKNELLSIGEIAKLTGAGIRALHYYERKNILKPAYTDPHTNYRYYSLDQLYYVMLIMHCVQLDIPLQKLSEAIQANNMSRIEDFFKQCNIVAERKIKVLTSGIDAFNKALDKIVYGKKHQPGQICSKDFTEKYYQTRLCERPPKGAELLRTLVEDARALYGENFNRITEEDDLDELLSLPDIGCLSIHSPKGVCYYSFTEIPKSHANENSIMIPAGTCFVRQDENSLLENAGEIFKEYIRDADHFMVIETQESFYSKSKISQPMYELRLVVQHGQLGEDRGGS